MQHLSPLNTLPQGQSFETPAHSFDFWQFWHRLIGIDAIQRDLFFRRRSLYQLQLMLSEVVGIDAGSATAEAIVINAIKAHNDGIENATFFNAGYSANITIPVGFGAFDSNFVTTI